MRIRKLTFGKDNSWCGLPDGKRFDKLCDNLASFIDSGVLKPYPFEHHVALPSILKLAGDGPAIVFLDPHGPTDMRLERDLRPWAIRERTDVLGTFMGNGTARICAEALASPRPHGSRSAAKNVLGEGWQHVQGEDSAYEEFESIIRKLKSYAGLYRLRKQDVKADAYGIFGLSDSIHGYHLLSNAVAKDWGALREVDQRNQTGSLFHEEDDQQIMRVIDDAVRPVVALNSRLRSDDLAREVLNSRPDLFGRYTDSDYTKAAKRVLGIKK